MAASETAAPRTYGNWRKPHSGGLWGLQRFGTLVAVGGLALVVLVVMLAGLLRGLVLFVVLVAVLGLVVRRDSHGKSVADRLRARVLFWTAQRDGSTLYRSGPLSAVPWGTYQLPGIAAATRLSEHRDAYGRPFALVECPATATFAAVVAVTPEGASLVDQEQVDTWVAGWGRWLANLGNEASVEGLAVTVQTAPDSGHRLRREVQSAMSPHAPAFAREVLEEVVTAAPAASHVVRAWVTITFSATSAASGERRDAAAMGRELGARLPALISTLGATGAGSARAVAAAELCEVVRGAYSPAAASAIEQARGSGDDHGLTWSDVGPAAAEAAWDHYRHDDACSITWAMTDAPRGNVHCAILARLVQPHPDVDVKRVTLLYRPYDAAQSAAVVEADLRDAEFNVGAMRRPSARATHAMRSAAASAAEEAAGAGVVSFGMLVTATYTDPSRAPLARSAIETAAATARIRLRPLYGAQSSGFAAGLPLGLILSKHMSRVAATVTERM